jgi:hypothetical protein
MAAMPFRFCAVCVGVALLMISAIARLIVAKMPAGVEIETTRFWAIVIALCNAFWWLPSVVGIVVILVALYTYNPD